MGIIETLQAEIQSLKERVTALEQLTKGERKGSLCVHEIRRLTRDDIIEMAKHDVAELERRMENYEIRSFSMYAQYFINREKRTVVALVRQSTNFPPLKNRPVSRGIAKCAPGDCFNVYIGKAIALRRALGLEVPDEYLNAPQPTEVRVGDIIEYKGKRYTVSKASLKNGQCGVNSIAVHNGKIIDDTRADAE
jgi:hypothetical protein